MDMEPVLLCRSAAAKLCGVSWRTFDKMVKQGTMPDPVDLEPLSRKYWHRGQILAALDRAAGIKPEKGSDREERRNRYLRGNPNAGLY